MSAKITRLRIAGFKSFADPASIDILPGLTGIVGPNGCGKSNVVEALRWAMGESSARALRGGELDDLIFAGTSARPARSLAEVTLWLDDAMGLAPPPFSEAGTLEICRRAERGAGSDFRLNGRALRARDVTTMFADLSSGARSSSIVSQNRVSALIGAKPEERRSLLEEAAGITGLHARRHDAELKLRQAESNMERSDDLRQQLEARLAALDSQSVQARSYRTLSEAIREDEQMLAWLVYSHAKELVQRTGETLAAAEKERDEAASLSARAAQEGDAGKAQCLALRNVAEALRETRDTLRVSLETTRISLAQARSRQEESRQRCEQGESDHAIARARHLEVLQRLESLAREQLRLDDELTTLPQTLGALRDARSARARDLALSETHRARCAETMVNQRLEAQRLEAEHETVAARLAALHDEEASLVAAIGALQAELPDENELARFARTLEEKSRACAILANEQEQLARDVQESRLSCAKAERDAAQAQTALQEHREALARLSTRAQELDTQLGRFAAEHDTLKASRLDGDALDALDTRAETSVLSRDEAREAAGAAQSALSEHEQDLLRHESDRRSHEQQRSLLENERRQAAEAVSRLAAQSEALKTARASLIAECPDDAAGAACTARKLAAEAEIATLGHDIDTLVQARARARADHERAEKTLREARADHLALQARIEALRSSLPEDALPDTVLEALHIPPGLERAVASALGHTLEASLDPALSRAWIDLPALDAAPLPEGIAPLAGMIATPAALGRAFAHIGLVTDEAEGIALQKRLLPGQCLVARDGALWRWDGYQEAGNLASSTLGRVEHLAALRSLEHEAATTGAQLPALARDLALASAEDESLGTQLVSLRERLQRAETTAFQSAQEEAGFLAGMERHRAQISQNDQALAESALQQEQAQHRVRSADEALATLPDQQTLRLREETLRHQLQQARASAEETGKAARLAEAACNAARDEATRLRLQDEATAARLLTLSGVLAQARRDREALSADRNRLDALDPESGTQELLLRQSEARDLLQARLSRLSEAENALAALRRDIAVESETLQRTRDVRLELSSRLSALLPRRDAIGVSRSGLIRQQESLPPIPDLTPLRLALDEAQADETAQREQHRLALEAQRRAENDLSRAEQEREQLNQRSEEARSRESALGEDILRLEARIATAREEHALAQSDHIRLETRLGDSATALNSAEKDYDDAAGTLASLESAIETLARTRQQEEQRCATARETVIRLQERLDQARRQFATLDETPPEPPPGVHDTPPAERNETATKRRLSRNLKEREALGPVNLLAEQEFTEAQAQATHLAHEHQELDSAIARLRGSINMLKKEGRERLQAIFVEVDRHFQSLFSRMFNGGKAHLGLVGSDDPLEAGLEIFAQPPGKKLSTLSLLSGGEQALTALSLIFATFRCQPSPLCILDEVDAPLDDANVERLCGLLRDMTDEAQTRFLIVTHHQLTMAHMDRLFGVTMQERGVSQVLSVDLSAAASFVENGALAVAR